VGDVAVDGSADWCELRLLGLGSAVEKGKVSSYRRVEKRGLRLRS